MDPHNWDNEAQWLSTHAVREGWSTVGFTDTAPFIDAQDHALVALKEGRLSGMPWMHERRIRQAATISPRYPWAHSIISLAWPYAPRERTADVTRTSSVLEGQMAAYATVRHPETNAVIDYHTLLLDRCQALSAAIKTRHPTAQTKAFVDHGWALDRGIAERAGIGFIGKNSCLITQEAGSFVLLAAIVCSLPFPPSMKQERSCGSCTQCKDRCPTGAIIADFTIDARKCISFWTIEHTGHIPVEFRRMMGNWVFGCDLCQDVCPINERKVRGARLPNAEQQHQTGPVPFPHLLTLLQLEPDSFAKQFSGTAVARTGWESLIRNTAIACGNSGQKEALGPLSTRLETTSNPVIKEACTWAISQLLDLP